MKELSTLQNLIYEIRGQKVMLDSDLAELYDIETLDLLGYSEVSEKRLVLANVA